MILSSKQRRLLKLLAQVDELGGRVSLSLEHGGPGDHYRVRGWKATSSDPMDVDFTVGANDVDELARNQMIQRFDNGDTSITRAGRSLLEE
jgi:hypothetical protein